MRRVPVWLMVALSLTAVAGCGKSEPKPKKATVGELHEIYPISVGSRSAWMLDRIEANDATFRGKSGASADAMRSASTAGRSVISDHLRGMTQAQRDTSEWLATRLPHYKIADLMKSFDGTVEVLDRRGVLFDPDIVRERMTEYVADLGGDDAFKAKHPDNARILDRIRQK